MPVMLEQVQLHVFDTEIMAAFSHGQFRAAWEGILKEDTIAQRYFYMLENLVLFANSLCSVAHFVCPYLLQKTEEVIRWLFESLLEAGSDLGRVVVRIIMVRHCHELLSLTAHRLHVVIHDLSQELKVGLSRRHNAKGIFDQIELPLELLKVHKSVNQGNQVAITVDFLSFFHFNGLRGVNCEAEHVSTHIILAIQYLFDILLQLF